MTGYVCDHCRAVRDREPVIITVPASDTWGEDADTLVGVQPTRLP